MTLFSETWYIMCNSLKDRYVCSHTVNCFINHAYDICFRLAILSLSSIVDRVFYGEWVYVHYNFLQFNVLSNMGAFYGSHPWHWYITQGFVVIMGTHVFPFLMAARKGTQPAMLSVIMWTIFVYRWAETVFLYCCLDCPSCLVHLSNLGTLGSNKEV